MKNQEKDVAIIIKGAAALEFGLNELEENGIDIGEALHHAQAVLEILCTKYPEIADRIDF